MTSSPTALDVDATAAPASSDILLVTLNASYVHAAFGLRYLMANMGDLRDRTALVERTIKEKPLAIVEDLLAMRPKIIGLGVYIWNIRETTEVAALLKRLQPSIVLVAGGPEISHEHEEQPLAALVDHIVTGEGEVTFPKLCRLRLAGEDAPHTLRGELPDTQMLVLPYDLYTDQDLANRVLYVEASRGCPFRCEFCLSSLDQKVRNVPLEPFLHELRTLLQRGARRFKFVDRTFNLRPKTSRAILEFFLENLEPDLFLHFEMVPDRFPESLRGLIAQFPPGAVQLEVGVQTMKPDVAAAIDRKQDNDKILDNLRYLADHTGVHLHVDLIVGLPGEDLASFQAGFNQLWATGAQEIQVGILKRLRGAPIARHTDAFEMVYSPLPPYEILRNSDWTMHDLARMRRFARYWRDIANSGRFKHTLPLLLAPDDPFGSFLALSDWVYSTLGRAHGLSFQRQIAALFGFLTEVVGLEPETVAEALYADHRRITGKRHVPRSLRGVVSPTQEAIALTRSGLPTRQRHHHDH